MNKGILFLAAAVALTARTEELPAFGNAQLVERIDCAKTDSGFIEFPVGASKVEAVLGSPCRVLPTQENNGSFFGYRLGRGKGLKANTPYILVVEYPEDAPRTIIVRNGADESSRGFYTGKALGDAFQAKYVDGHCESLDIPLSQKYERWASLTFLNDRVAPNNGEKKSLVPETDGFDVVLAQYAKKHAPLSRGIAARSISLYEWLGEGRSAPSPDDGLPRRHLFWREEMSDGVIQGKGQGEGVTNRIDWFEHKARLMRFLGMDTYAKDLLEFGAVQHWEPGAVKQNWIWDDGNTRDVWGRVVEMMGRYGFSILPYYEYCGGLGPDRDGAKCLGYQKRAKTMGGKPNYTHIGWVEKANADITDSDTVADFKLVLDATILRFRDKARFLGAWIRPRQQLPVGFGDATLARFSEANGGAAVTREALKADKALYAKYIDWWGQRRAAFCTAMRDYLRQNGVSGAAVIYSNCGAEPGPGLGGWRTPLFTDDQPLWRGILGDKPELLSTADVVRGHLYLKGMETPAATWGDWEWQHASPADDPQHYAGLSGVFLAHPFNRLFTVADPETFRAYTNKDGGQALVRHHSLNENMVYRKDGDKEARIIGYEVADMERAGRACMQSEVVAMANGNPYFIGYLVGSNFARGFPDAVRDFNRNFLALPALPSRVLSSGGDVTLREIDAGPSGKFYAIAHTGSAPKRGVAVQFPEGTKRVTLLADGRELPGPTVTLDFQPWQLIAVRAR